MTTIYKTLIILDIESLTQTPYKNVDLILDSTEKGKEKKYYRSTITKFTI